MSKFERRKMKAAEIRRRELDLVAATEAKAKAKKALEDARSKLTYWAVSVDPVSMWVGFLHREHAVAWRDKLIAEARARCPGMRITGHVHLAKEDEPDAIHDEMPTGDWSMRSFHNCIDIAYKRHQTRMRLLAKGGHEPVDEQDDPDDDDDDSE